jgi:major type 1 subunit fimbrin (pilin)
MNMKIKSPRSIFACGFGATLIILSAQAWAADGTITFEGSIDASSCTIEATGGGASFTVQLPQVGAQALSAAAQTAGDTPFSIRLSGCSDVAGIVWTNFEAGTAVDTATGRLNNTATIAGADNVQIQLLNASDGSPIVVGAPPTSQNSHGIALVPDADVATEGVATLNYFARYYATGVATAGSVSSIVTYSLILP